MAIACAFAAAVVVAFFAGSAWGADVPNDVGPGSSRPEGVLGAASLGSTPGPAFSPELLSAESAAAGMLMEAQRVNDFNNAVVLLEAEAERERMAEVAAVGVRNQVAPGRTPPAVASSSAGRASSDFLACTRAHESDSAGGYQAVSSGGTYRGAYQFSQSTWNNTAAHAGRDDLVGADPASASPADQDAMAQELYAWQGNAPWGGRC